MIRGPQSAGLLFGKASLIEAAKLNYSPHEAPIGRPMKVNKEEIFGMYAALKSYLEKDHDKEWQQWMDRTAKISAILDKMEGVETKVVIPQGPANVFPTLDVIWDTDKFKIMFFCKFLGESADTCFVGHYRIGFVTPLGFRINLLCSFLVIIPYRKLKFKLTLFQPPGGFKVLAVILNHVSVFVKSKIVIPINVGSCTTLIVDVSLEFGHQLLRGFGSFIRTLKLN